MSLHFLRLAVIFPPNADILAVTLHNKVLESFDILTVTDSKNIKTHTSSKFKSQSSYSFIKGVAVCM